MMQQVEHSVMATHATLVISQPGHKTRNVEISTDVTSIGRTEGNSVRLQHDRNVSRRHAEIRLRDDAFWIADLGTRNGTTVNGAFVESEQKLAHGDVIRLGGTSAIEFRLAEQQKPAAEPALPSEISQPAKAEPTITPAPASSVLVMIVGIAGGVVLIALFGTILFATSGTRGKKSEHPIAQNSNVTAPPSASPVIDDEDATPLATPEAEPTEIASESPTPVADTHDVQAGDAQILAAKIAPKNYRFDPAFVRLIGGYVNEYKSAGNYYPRAKKYRDAIDKEFLNIQGLPPLFAYVMAMSRTKLSDDTGDVWKLPSTVTKAESAGSATTDGNNPAHSTKIAASYIRSLWDVFGKDGFMYVVACYGMTLDQAGVVQQQLEIKDPTGQARYDFWRMKSLGVVNGEQTERVARFFAAGIVIENPQQFGLNEPPLSTLY
jgi:pSer/pThr/pTyr-binding forkhead associated (FHA) protein